MPIRSFRSKALKRYWIRGDTAAISPTWRDKVRLILSRLDKATQPAEMDSVGMNFHSLRGDQTGRFSVLVTRNWRITFAWHGNDAVDVDLEDYHGN
ncbi:MAG: type II toxin-antitoxin system RelE/ParE family toxin [Methylobacteriaceae bacterium]|nr:type II toxin-antitoxin system RelE/ParE family toxin [Methylobacteriaceae bacterium]